MENKMVALKLFEHWQGYDTHFSIQSSFPTHPRSHKTGFYDDSIVINIPSSQEENLFFSGNYGSEGGKSTPTESDSLKNASTGLVADRLPSTYDAEALKQKWNKEYHPHRRTGFGTMGLNAVRDTKSDGLKNIDGIIGTDGKCTCKKPTSFESTSSELYPPIDFDQLELDLGRLPGKKPRRSSFGSSVGSRSISNVDGSIDKATKATIDNATTNNIDGPDHKSSFSGTIGTNKYGERCSCSDQPSDVVIANQHNTISQEMRRHFMAAKFRQAEQDMHSRLAMFQSRLQTYQDAFAAVKSEYENFESASQNARSAYGHARTDYKQNCEKVLENDSFYPLCEQYNSDLMGGLMDRGIPPKCLIGEYVMIEPFKGQVRDELNKIKQPKGLFSFL